jgi:hypothetical protein
MAGRRPRVLRRVWQIYAAHLLLFLILVAEIAYAAAITDKQAYVEAMGVAAFFDQPGIALIHALLLQFRPLNMDVLPLYVVLMLFVLRSIAASSNPSSAPRQIYVIDFECIQFVGSPRVHSILRHSTTFFPAFRRLSAHGAHTRGNYHQTEIRLLESPSPTKAEICQRGGEHRKTKHKSANDSLPAALRMR